MQSEHKLPQSELEPWLLILFSMPITIMPYMPPFLLNISLLLLARLSDVCHIADHNAFPLCSQSHPCTPYWPKSLDNFVFLSLWKSSVGSLLISQISLNSCMYPLVIFEPCHLSSPVEFLLSVLRDYVFHSTQLPKLPCFESAHATIFPAWIFP